MKGFSFVVSGNLVEGWLYFSLTLTGLAIQAAKQLYRIFCVELQHSLEAEANNIERVSHVAEKLSEIAGTGEPAFAAGIAAAVYRKKTSSGTFTPNVIYSNVGGRLMGEFIYHEFNLLTEIAGGLSVTLPFEGDFLGEEIEEDLKKLMIRKPRIFYEDSCRIWGS